MRRAFGAAVAVAPARKPWSTQDTEPRRGAGSFVREGECTTVTLPPENGDRVDRDSRQAISHWIEDRTGWSIKKFVRTARRYRTIQIQAAGQTITAADPIPDDLRAALNEIHRRPGAH